MNMNHYSHRPYILSEVLDNYEEKYNKVCLEISDLRHKANEIYVKQHSYIKIKPPIVSRELSIRNSFVIRRTMDQYKRPRYYFSPHKLIATKYFQDNDIGKVCFETEEECKNKIYILKEEIELQNIFNTISDKQLKKLRNYVLGNEEVSPYIGEIKEEDKGFSVEKYKKSS